MAQRSNTSTLTRTERTRLQAQLLTVGSESPARSHLVITDFERFLHDTGRVYDSGRNVNKEIFDTFGPSRGYDPCEYEDTVVLAVEQADAEIADHCNRILGRK